MISQETKDRIEKEATEYSRRIKQESGIYTFKDCYTNVATKYAEQLEEKDKEIEGFKEAVQNLHDGYDVCKNDYQKVIAKHKAQLESKERELAQLKEIAEKMNILLNAIFATTELTYDHANKVSSIQTAYAEWCKQNLK